MSYFILIKLRPSQKEEFHETANHFLDILGHSFDLTLPLVDYVISVDGCRAPS